MNGSDHLKGNSKPQREQQTTRNCQHLLAIVGVIVGSRMNLRKASLHILVLAKDRQRYCNSQPLKERKTKLPSSWAELICRRSRISSNHKLPLTRDENAVTASTKCATMRRNRAGSKLVTPRAMIGGFIKLQQQQEIRS